MRNVVKFPVYILPFGKHLVAIESFGLSLTEKGLLISKPYLKISEDYQDLKIK